MQLSCSLPLPASFRPNDILAFHRRDPQEIAERVSASTLHKGLVWRERPASLFIEFQPLRALATLDVDGADTEDSQVDFERMARRMLGLSQDIDRFEQQYRHHPQLGALITRHPGLRVPLAATPFEALAWAIAGQQISVSAAVSLRRKLIVATDIRHSSGLLCHPQARQILALPEAALRQAGFSTSKNQALLTLSELVTSGQLPLDAWVALDPLPVDAMRAQLEAVRGIGPWTVNYTLLRGFGWLDGSLHGDVAVRRGLQTLLEAPEKPSEAETRGWLAPFSPWRALIGAHIWATLSSIAY